MLWDYFCTSRVDPVNAFHCTENKHHHCTNVLLRVSHNFTVSFFSLTFWTVSRPLVVYGGLLGSQRFANLHPRTLSSYWTSFKSFHFHHKLQFHHFSLTTISYFATFVHYFKQIQLRSIKTYLSGIHFFHKQIFGHQWPTINNSQISLLIKDLKKLQPSYLDYCLPLTC